MAHPRSRSPEIELEFSRKETLGYEPPDRWGHGCVRYLTHGLPHPLVRWHHHEEYELHLIVETKGKVFVGDYIGHFEPGHLVLTGPNLPHNWISSNVPTEGVALRDMVLLFQDKSLRQAMNAIPEIAELLPLLERARFGIEFFGMREFVQIKMERIQKTKGLHRFTEFLALMDGLAHCTDYRLLSTVQLQSFADDASLAQINSIVEYITENTGGQLSMSDVCHRLNMSESQFSRYFSRATGNTFTEFVNRLRINKACQLLMETNLYVTRICYEVGFNNVANFNRRFLQIKGITPTEFRRQAEARFGIEMPQ
jgi:AraC-like DNA-binding protein